MKNHALTLILLLLGLNANLQTTSYFDDPHRFIPEKLADYKHISAWISIDTLQQTLKGKVEFKLTTIRSDVDTLKLLAPKFEIHSVSLDASPAVWFIGNDYLNVLLPRRRMSYASHALEIEYTVRQSPELYFVGWNDTTFTMRRQIWAHRPYTWLPFVNDRLTMDFYITFSSRYQVFSNGVRLNVTTNKNGTSTWHYQMKREHPFFSTAIVIGHYKWKSFKASNGLPVELWYYPDREDHFESTYMLMDEMIRFCEDEFGMPYPYEVYRQAPVANYLFAGMETTTSTIFGDYLHIDQRAFWERNYVNVNVHEFIHQWFGNYISHLRPNDVWLTESFATYYAKLFERKYFGEDYYQWERHKEFQRMQNASKHDDFAIADSRGGIDRWYAKGSFVLDYLRNQLGDDDFRKAIKHYLFKFANSEVWTYDLRKAIYEATGRSVDSFFDQWIERGGEPHYVIDYEDHGMSLFIRVRQTQPVSELRPVFKGWIEFEAYFLDATQKVYRFWNQDTLSYYVLPKEGNILFLLFNPANQMPATYTFNRSVNERLDQYLNAKRITDRFEALVSLRDEPLEVKRSFYLMHAEQNSHYLVRAELLEQLRHDTATQSIALFEQSLKHQETMVRRAALQRLERHHFTSLKELIISCLDDISYSNVIAALEKLAIYDNENLPTYLTRTASEKGFPGLNLRIAWLRLAIQSGRSEYIPELVDYCSLRYDFRTRINAINAVSELRIWNDRTLHEVIEAALQWNNHLMRVATDALRKAAASSDDIAQQLKSKLDAAGSSEKAISLANQLFIK
jgi:aminopeptidase N